MLFGEKSSGHVNFLTGADSEGGRCRGDGVRGIEADLKKKCLSVFNSMLCARGILLQARQIMDEETHGLLLEHHRQGGGLRPG